MIHLRPLTVDDITAIQRIFSGASVRYTHGPHHRMTRTEASTSISKILEQDHQQPRRHWNYGISVNDDLVGVIKSRRRAPGLATVSYTLREDTWGNGYATHALKQLIPIVVAEATIERMEAKHHRDNPASGRVLTKAGFIHTGTVHLLLPDDTSTAPYETYALDWS